MRCYWCAWWRKRELIETILVIIISSWPFCQRRPKRRWFHWKRRILSCTRSPREWVLLVNFNNVNDEWLWGRSWWLPSWKTKKNRPNLWLEHVAQSRQINTQQEMESQRRFHLSLMDRRFVLSTRSWLIDDWLDLIVLEAEKRPSSTESEYKGQLNRESLRAADGVRPPFIKGAQSVPLEILTIHSSKKRTRGDGQVDWKNVIALETLEGFLDGHVTDVRPEWRAKNKPVSCRRGLGECWKTNEKWDGFGSERTAADTTPTCTRAGAHFSRAHITVHSSHFDPHFSHVVTSTLAQGKRNQCRAFL